jgi:hypothetical protein
LATRQKEPKENERRKKTLNRIFDNPKLRWLAALRHVLVHNAGRADAGFLRDVRGYKRFSSTPKDEHVRLEGNTIATLVENSINCGNKLVNFVSAEIEQGDATRTRERRRRRT